MNTKKTIDFIIKLFFIWYFSTLIIPFLFIHKDDQTTNFRLKVTNHPANSNILVMEASLLGKNSKPSNPVLLIYSQSNDNWTISKRKWLDTKMMEKVQEFLPQSSLSYGLSQWDEQSKTLQFKFISDESLNHLKKENQQFHIIYIEKTNYLFIPDNYKVKHLYVNIYQLIDKELDF